MPHILFSCLRPMYTGREGEGKLKNNFAKKGPHTFISCHLSNITDHHCVPLVAGFQKYEEVLEYLKVFDINLYLVRELPPPKKNAALNWILSKTGLTPPPADFLIFFGKLLKKGRVKPALRLILLSF